MGMGMMSDGRFLCVAVCVAACASQKASNPISPSNDAPTLRVDVNLVPVGASVTGQDGRPVQNMRREDFVLVEDGKQRPIQYLWREDSVPLSVGLIVDISGSQRRFIAEHKRTIARFLKQVLRPQDQAFVVAVASEVRLVTDLTHSAEKLQNSVEELENGWRSGVQLGEPCRDPGARTPVPTRPPFAGRRGRIGRIGCGGTALWNGVYYSARLKMKPVSGRKALIVLTDGMDTGSKHGLTDAIEAAQSADTLVYTIRYGGVPAPLAVAAPGLIFKYRGELRRLSRETGGRAYGSPSGDPSEIFAEIEEELRNLYILAFTAPDGDGKFHKLEVKSRRAGIAVRARKGYVAAP